jgi:ribosomal protein S18 acetylase RimI-like enzyme
MNKQTPAAVKKSISPLRIHYIIKTGSQNIGWFNLRKPFDSTIGMFGMIIDKPFQGQGFGQEAMKLIKQEAKKIGIKKLLLEVESKNFKAINLYVGFGFKATRRFIEMEKKI